MRDTVVRELIALAREDQTVNLITGDLGFGVLKPFWEALPDRFINAGITEQNLTGVAAGMALEGKKVFTYSIANFPTLRCLEQIRNDCAYHDADVKIICVGGGYVYGALGMSHHATEDIACMRALPNVTVICPADAVEAKYALRAIANAAERAARYESFILDGKLYETTHHAPKFACIDLQTGKTIFNDQIAHLRQGQIITADGLLYIYDSARGNVILAKPVPEKGFEEISRFKFTDGSGEHWCHPVIADKVLYIRRGDTLVAFDLKP